MRIALIGFAAFFSAVLSAAELTNDQGLAAVMGYVLGEQRAYAWDASDKNHTRMIADINGHVYEIRDGQALKESPLPLAYVTKGCFGDSINVGRDMYKLSPEKDSSLNKASRAAEVGHLGDILGKLARAGKIGASEIGGGLLTALTLSLEYEDAQLRIEAERMQTYLNTPKAQSTVKEWMRREEILLRGIQILIVNNGYVKGIKTAEGDSHLVDFALNGRAECFPAK